MNLTLFVPLLEQIPLLVAALETILRPRSRSPLSSSHADVSHAVLPDGCEHLPSLRGSEVGACLKLSRPHRLVSVLTTQAVAIIAIFNIAIHMFMISRV